ncbi:MULTISPECIES: phosphogluconate dehydratase [unclassified Brevundimonas]|uniref:phosphogluconate dehydratase n=1 Tax=unclassified Brevundimonas TaxID=2622653 RepID=UPI000CFB9E4D|nr:MULTISPECIES: phosphogluconate dehydratase [unclassified Brevundimonas]PRA29522.1 phosphogluconate dehydratase [Brevundimonas sp. MYb27]PQZ83639.1 phosphogluconate dehydratase [Brevundimonas sp. MYb31]PRB15773.1 phosphogluconate dehydratase [Brevundimonas sp. MYb52]PRB36269.1 phosphogluconate dehydratase [Brevundimonas sp. MYb46]PRB46820.1 phosphogluconate dehydratase [Brevundimonas sp. MYb33]
MALNPPLNPVVAEVTVRIIERSRATRADYLRRMDAARDSGAGRAKLSCANWAHAFAGQTIADKLTAMDGSKPNVGVVTAYNDMLSAHQPFERFPEVIRKAVREVGATAQVAGGTPAMCDGVTQGRPGMELSLFSRDAIAMATGVALTHDAFDSAMMLGVCDKIVPGLFMGALAFGHLPVVFAPAGPMPSGIPNAEKARVRAEYAQGLVDRTTLLASEIGSYHSPGTCTFYGTANSNQMMMEIAGLHLPSTAFVHPETGLRDALTAAAAKRAVELARSGEGRMADVVSEKTIVNMIVALLATGGSTNHAIHLVAMARAAGVLIDWTDMDQLSSATPLLARVYPNGSADVNAFQAAGGTAFVTRELVRAGILHNDVTTIMGQGMEAYFQEPCLIDGELVWRDTVEDSLDLDILRPASNPFQKDGGLRLVQGDLGRAVIKVSAVKPENRIVEAPAAVFETQEDALQAFKDGKLNRDVVLVLRFQGPKANGMPELHSLSPALSVLQDKGFKVAFVTDGRMSGASGKTPAAIHVSPEALAGGPLAHVRDGDIIRLDAEAGVLTTVGVADLTARPLAVRSTANAEGSSWGYGRELFGAFRHVVSTAEQGASVCFALPTGVGGHTDTPPNPNFVDRTVDA